MASADMKCGAGPAPVQATESIGMLRLALQAQKQEGQAALSLIESSTPPAVQGAPEPGKGGLVAVRA